MSQFTLAIPRATIAAVSRFMAKQDIRYYINGLHVECYANIAYVVATDGHTLALGRVTRETSGDIMTGQGSLIIPREFVEKIKANGNNGMPVTLSVDGEAFTLDDCGMKTSGKAIDGKFPDWRRVIPRKASGEAAFFNPEYLMRCFKAGQDLGSKRGAFQLAYNGKAAALVTFDNLDVLAVVMPMREDPAECPEWVGENPEGFGRESDLEKAWTAALEIESAELPIAA